MAAIELRHRDGSPATTAALKAIQAMLCRGFILLPEGADANVISFTPSLTITAPQLEGAVSALRDVLAQPGSRP